MTMTMTGAFRKGALPAPATRSERSVWHGSLFWRDQHRVTSIVSAWDTLE